MEKCYITNWGHSTVFASLVSLRSVHSRTNGSHWGCLNEGRLDSFLGAQETQWTWCLPAIYAYVIRGRELDSGAHGSLTHLVGTHPRESSSMRSRDI